jgi:hypothetical protein
MIVLGCEAAQNNHTKPLSRVLFIISVGQDPNSGYNSGYDRIYKTNSG